MPDDRPNEHPKHAQIPNLIQLDPDVAAEYPDAEAANNALRMLIDARKRAKASLKRRAEGRESGGSSGHFQRH